MLRLGCEGVESQYRSVVWEEKKKEKNMFIRKKEKKIREREREETQTVPERKNIYGLRRVLERKESSTPYGQMLV